VTAAVLVIIGVLAFFAVILLASAVRVLREYERGVIFRLGRLIAQKGPGLIFLIPIIDRMVRVDLRTVTLNIPPQEVITRDNVPASVNAVCYFRVVNPNDAIVPGFPEPSPSTAQSSGVIEDHSPVPRSGTATLHPRSACVKCHNCPAAGIGPSPRATGG